MEFLKALFGASEDGTQEALTYEQLLAKLEANKDKLQIVNLKDGGYVSKEKFTAKETEIAGLQAQIKDANAQIESYKGMDIDGVKKSAEEWKTKYEADTKALQEQLTAQEVAHQRDMYFTGIQFASNAAKLGTIAEFEKQGFQLKDGKFLGADEWLAKQKEADPGSFVVEKKEGEGDNQQGQQNQQMQNHPRFAQQTSTGSGNNQQQKQNLFGMNFTGVRKVPTQQ